MQKLYAMMLFAGAIGSAANSAALPLEEVPNVRVVTSCTLTGTEFLVPQVFETVAVYTDGTSVMTVKAPGFKMVNKWDPTKRSSDTWYDKTSVLVPRFGTESSRDLVQAIISPFDIIALAKKMEADCEPSAGRQECTTTHPPVTLPENETLQAINVTTIEDGKLLARVLKHRFSKSNEADTVFSWKAVEFDPSYKHLPRKMVAEERSNSRSEKKWHRQYTLQVTYIERIDEDFDPAAYAADQSRGLREYDPNQSPDQVSVAARSNRRILYLAGALLIGAAGWFFLNHKRKPEA